MSIRKLNHAVLYVKDAVASADFYISIFEMEIVAQMPGAVFLRAKNSNNDHDLGLFSIGQTESPYKRGSSVGLYHLAWQVDTLEDLIEFEEKLKSARRFIGATNHGATKSIYGKDLDDIDFEIMWIIPSELVGPEDVLKSERLDLDSEIKRFGADTPSRQT